MSIELKDIFNPDKERLVENKRKTAIKNMIILCCVLVVLIVIALIFKFSKNVDKDRRIAITKDAQNIRTAILAFTDRNPDEDLPGMSLEAEGVKLNVNGVIEEYRYGYYLLESGDLAKISAALNIPNETYAVNYETGDVINAAGIKYNGRIYHSLDDMLAIENGEVPLSDKVEIISSARDMEKLRMYPNGYFKLSANIDMSEYSIGEGWQTIPEFSGILDGRGYTISNLTINAPVKNYVGLFGNIKNEARVTNIKFSNVNVIGGQYTGVLAGHASGQISFVHILSGTVTGNSSSVGGLCGAYSIGKINNCTIAVNVDGDSNVGGAVGTLYSGTLNKVSAKGNVTGIESVGGFIGLARVTDATYIHECASKTKVNGKKNLGGFVGDIELTADQKSITIANSYVDGAVETGEENLGGLFGKVATIQGTPSITFENLYANVSVVPKGATSGGGIGNCSIGVSTTRNVTNCYWAKILNPGEELRDIGLVADGSTLSFEARDINQMRMLSNYNTWDFTKIWEIKERASLPVLQWEKAYTLEVKDEKK